MNKLWKTAAAPLALCLCAVLAFSACSSDSDSGSGGGQSAGRFAGTWRMDSYNDTTMSSEDPSPFFLKIMDDGRWTYSQLGTNYYGTCEFNGNQVVCVWTSSGYSFDWFTLTLDASGNRLSGEWSSGTGDLVGMETVARVTFVRE